MKGSKKQYFQFEKFRNTKETPDEAYIRIDFEKRGSKIHLILSENKCDRSF